MASPLARRAVRSAHRCSLASSPARRISTTPTQDSWFSKIFRGSAAETPPPSTPEQNELEKANQSGPPQPSAPKNAESQSKLPRRAQDTPVKSAPQPAFQPAPATGSITPASTVLPRRKRNRRIPLLAENANDKHRLFHEHVSFMESRLGRNPQLRHPFIRKSTWIRTLALCQTEEQLRKVMEMIPLWRDMGHNFDTTFSHAFIRRCLYLNKPEFTLELFGDFGKYNVLLTRDGAREMLNATYDKQPIDFIVTLTRLFGVYRLGPFRNDYACCAMVIAACLRSKRKDARVLADALLPHLKTLVEKSGPLTLPKGQEVDQKLPLVWGIDAMKKVDRRLPSQQAKANTWLHSWRVESGHKQARV